MKALRALGETEHLSAYTLPAVGREVVWRVSEHEAVALTAHPVQHVIAEMIDILNGFTGAHGRRVVPLLQPAPWVPVDAAVCSGYPVVDGTPVPYDLVAGLLADGIAPADIAAFYPNVTPKGARGALAFALYVAEHRPDQAA